MTYIYRVHYKNREVAISLVKPEVSDQIEQVEELEMLLPTDYTVGENWKNEKMIFDEKGNGCKLSATNSKHVIVAESIATRYPKRKGIRVDDKKSRGRQTSRNDYTEFARRSRVNEAGRY